MSTVFISSKVWPQLTKAVGRSQQGCSVAAAYFSAGASPLLPVHKGSRLVVDASDRAVASGQTCPTDLLKLVKRGVAVYSVPNVHAKVFVLGKTAYVGSANVSSRSASHLIEAVLRTTEPSEVQAARKFVEDLCLHELTPEVLEQLGKLYRPPVAGSKRKQRSDEFVHEPIPIRTLVCLGPTEGALVDSSVVTPSKGLQGGCGERDCFEAPHSRGIGKS